MPTPKKRKPYNVIYCDQTYQTFDLTNDDLDALVQKMETGAIVRLSDSRILATKDIRTIVPYIEKPVEKPELTVPAELDNESRDWLVENTSQFYNGEGRSFEQ